MKNWSLRFGHWLYLCFSVVSNLRPFRDFPSSTLKHLVKSFFRCCCNNSCSKRRNAKFYVIKSRSTGEKLVENTGEIYWRVDFFCSRCLALHLILSGSEGIQPHFAVSIFFPVQIFFPHIFSPFLEVPINNQTLCRERRQWRELELR